VTPASWRSAALIALWVQVAAVFGAAAYGLERGQFSEGAWLSAAEALLAGLVLSWWTVILGRVTAGLSVPPEDGTLRALGLLLPWLTSFRLVLWGLNLLFLLDGRAPEANPVALTALMTVWLALILSRNAVYGTLARLAPNPGDAAARSRLADWLNLSAALSLAMTVFNLVPLAGFSRVPTLTDQLVTGVSGAINVIATLLALQAVQKWSATRQD